MQNRLLKLIIFSSFLLSLTSCSSSKKNDPILMPYRQIFDSSISLKESLAQIDKGRLESLISDKSTFTLMIQGDSSDCVCYSWFLEALTSYMKEVNARIYHIKIDDLPDTLATKAQTNANLIAVFKDGKLVKQKLFKDGDSSIEDHSLFKNEMNKLVSFKTNVAYINKRQLDLLYSTKEIAGFVIGFGRESCSDCRYLYSHFLKDEAYLLSSPLYLFDVDEIRNSSLDEYDSFKEKYGLTSKSNYGYLEGVVPTFQYVTPGLEDINDMVKDAAVYMNDVLLKDGDKFKISQSYYDGSRVHEFLFSSSLQSNLIDLEIPQEDVMGSTSFSWKKDKASIYHDPLLKAFLSFYLGEK